ncbi:hypothetical protein LUZ60_015048 [Juncus effusus]|nr:hypothetical protein LUZ60_015048 [Juncus effusus]
MNGSCVDQPPGLLSISSDVISLIHSLISTLFLFELQDSCRKFHFLIYFFLFVVHEIVQEMEFVEDIVIVGAGLNGLATALGLHRKGIKSLILESSSTLRTTGFAFTMWTNSWHALDALGVGDKVREHHVRTEQFVLLSATTGKTSAEMSMIGMPGKHGELENRCVRREFLQETLANELPKGTIKYSSKIESIQEEGNLKILHLTDGSLIKTKVLIGCDGINSVVAKYLGLKKPSFSGRLAARGLAKYETNHGFKPVFIQISGRGIRFGIIPSSEKNVYWFFTWRPSQIGGEKVDESATTMREYIITKLTEAKAPKEIIEMVKQSEMSQVVSSPLNYRSPFSLINAKITKNNICVAGDALHPMTPDLGQGGCMALEDSVILAKYLSEVMIGGEEGSDGEYEKIQGALEKFGRNRRWRSVRLITTAYLIGFVQQSDNWFVSFLREKVLAGFMARTLLQIPDYDCGKL